MLRIKDGIVDRLRALKGERPSIDRQNPDVRVFAPWAIPDLAALRSPLRAGFARVRRQPQLAFAFLQHAGLAF